MFAFYFAILSAITPPVALAVYAAAGIAKSDLWATGLAAVRIAATSFIVPFMFVYEPALLMIGDWPTIIWASITAASASCCLPPACTAISSPIRPIGRARCWSSPACC